MTIQEFFEQYPKAALGFSGGVDSAFLLWAARNAGADIRPYFIHTAFQPQFELEDAKRLAARLDVKLTVLEYDILQHPAVAANPNDRCYHCKNALFSLLRQQSLTDGYTILLDGTNASDEAEDRPGMRAIRELGVLSPLQLCGLTKDEIRRRSREAGLFTWDKPAYACLATRIPSGTAITLQSLQITEAAEEALMSMGYRDFRVRCFHGAARVQLKRDQLPRTDEAYDALCRTLSRWYDTVLLDLVTR